MDQLRKYFLGDDRCSGAGVLLSPPLSTYMALIYSASLWAYRFFFYLAVSRLGYDDNDEGAIMARSHPRNTGGGACVS